MFIPKSFSLFRQPVTWKQCKVSKRSRCIVEHQSSKQITMNRKPFLAHVFLCKTIVTDLVVVSNVYPHSMRNKTFILNYLSNKLYLSSLFVLFTCCKSYVDLFLHLGALWGALLFSGPSLSSIPEWFHQRC